MMLRAMSTNENKRGKVTPENIEEAAKLKAIWNSPEGKNARAAADCISQEAFGAAYEIGNQAAVGFFLNGKTALSLKAAMAFARGLGCKVDDFSPRLARLIRPSQGALLEAIAILEFERLGMKVEGPAAFGNRVPPWLSESFGPGNSFYPDFKVTKPDGEEMWVEVKSPRSSDVESIGRLQRLMKENPGKFLLLVDEAHRIGDRINDWSQRNSILPANPSSSEGDIAHPMSQMSFETVPSLSWEQLMSEDPKMGTFSAAIPDDAMAPRVRAGTECFFKTGIPARPGAGVLVRDSGGHVYLREYREAAGGAWEAHATNPAYRTLHSQADGLRVIAVLRGVMRGWEEL